MKNPIEPKKLNEEDLSRLADYADFNPEDVAQIWGHIAALDTEITSLTIDKDSWESAARINDNSKSPCGHPAQYAFTPDGVGKQVLCYVCEVANLKTLYGHNQKSPCGHPRQYSYVFNDVTKTLICYVCSKEQSF